MTRDDITRMTLEANGRIESFINYDFGEEVALFYLEELERFAALVAAAEREAVGNIILDYAGRDDLSDSDESLLKHLFELIRARGER